MTLSRGIDGFDPPGERNRVARLSETQEERRLAATGLLATGTLACPTCDAPVAPAAPLAPADRVACPYCAHLGAVRDFLSLAAPARPARVAVRVLLRGTRRAGGAVS